MRRGRVKKVARSETVWISCRISRSSVACHGIVNTRPLSVIKNIKCLGAKLKSFDFGNNKVLEECHIEVCPARVA